MTLLGICFVMIQQILRSATLMVETVVDSMCGLTFVRIAYAWKMKIKKKVKKVSNVLPIFEHRKNLFFHNCFWLTDKHSLARA